MRVELLTSLRSLFTTASLTALLLASPASAQSIAGMIETHVRTSAADAWDVWTSPLRSRQRDWISAAGIVVLAGAVTPFDDNVDRWAVRHQHDNRFDALEPFRAGGAAFSGQAITPVALGVLALSLVAKNETVQEGLFGCATAYGASSMVRTFVVYPLVARNRPEPRVPNVIAPAAKEGDQYGFTLPGTSEWGGHSLPGGHIANIVARTEFLTNRFSMRFTEPAVWLLAGGIGLGRVLDRAHWASDQVVGIAFGYAVGRQIALRSKRRAQHRTVEHSNSGWNFFASPQHDAMRLGWNLRF